MNGTDRASRRARKPRDNREHLGSALRELQQAHNRVDMLIRDRYPKGSQVAWEHGEQVRTGVVLDLCLMGDDRRVQVQSGCSDAQPWICLSRILEYEEID